MSGSVSVFSLLLSESVLLLLAPHVHNLPVLVHLHGVVHQSVHVDELDALLLSIKQHGRDDRELSHLLLRVLTNTHKPKPRSERTDLKRENSSDPELSLKSSNLKTKGVVEF